MAKLHPARRYFRSPSLADGPIGRFFNGEATSEVGLKTGADKDFWVAMQPDLSELEPMVEEADRRFADSSLPVQGLAIVGIAQSYLDNPAPATFRVLVNPMALWLYIGGLIALTGGLIAVLPGAPARQRRLSSAYAARLGRELSRA